MACTHYFWNLKTPQNWLMPGLMFATTFCKRSPLGKRLRALFLGVSHHKQHTRFFLLASFSKLAFWSSWITPVCLIAQPFTHNDRKYYLSFIRLLALHFPSWAKACLKGIRSILLSLVRVLTRRKNIPRLGWTYFIVPSGHCFLSHGLQWCPQTEFFSGRCKQQCPDFPFLCQNGSGLEMIKGN